MNIYNFIRNSDYRVPNSEDVLFETTRQQLQLVNEHHLPATWALQYDALMNPKYQKLLKQNAGPEQEIAAWWEIPKPLAEKAGLKWRGDHDWDSTANIGFFTGLHSRRAGEAGRCLHERLQADFWAISPAPLGRGLSTK